MITKVPKWGPVSVMPGKNQGRYPYCHSIYIEEAGVLIDPGLDRERLQQIKRDNGFQMTWLSHWHEDLFRHLDLLEDLHRHRHSDFDDNLGECLTAKKAAIYCVNRRGTNDS